jgi:sulfhydrogenase subunit gamma (sulfur reductase)
MDNARSGLAATCLSCGIGICGRCNMGSKYVCLDGPVFSVEQVRGMVPEL